VEEAVQSLQKEPGPLDLIFLDIDKEAYPEALQVIESKLRPGGVLLADNMLLSGDALDGQNRSARSNAVRTFTERVMQGDRWIASIVPARDGLLLAYKT
jgi:predicted O-methyltransferase YrrM